MHISLSHWILATLVVSNPYVAASLPPAISQNCSQIAVHPLPIQQVASYFPPREIADLLATEAIRRTIALYPLVIDGRDWDSLGNIFADNAVANYSDPIGVVEGPSGIKSGLQPGLAQFAGTQHMLGASVIDVCSPDSAISVTYYTASHFLSSNSTATSITDDSQVLYAYGQYQDTWKRQKDGTWKIIYRNLVYMVRALLAKDEKNSDPNDWNRDHLSPMSHKFC